LREDEVVFVTVGRLTKQKNQHLLIESFAKVRRVVPFPVRCLIIGTGELEQELKSTAKSLRVSDCVLFLGNRTEIPDLLSACDVFVLSSDWEGNPLSLMEAMSAGRPVVATSVGGVPEIVEHGKTGLTVLPGDVQALAEAMALLASNPDLRETLGAHSAKVAVQRFGVQAMVRAYESLYMQMIGAT
jgi:glycosyltransferase involved in cell wall biosynthesis